MLGTCFFLHLKTADFTKSCLYTKSFQLFLSRLFSGRTNWGDKTILSELQMQKCPCVAWPSCLSPAPGLALLFPAMLKGCVVSLGHSKRWHRNHSSSRHWDTRPAMNVLEGIKLTVGFLEAGKPPEVNGKINQKLFCDVKHLTDF